MPDGPDEGWRAGRVAGCDDLADSVSPTTAAAPWPPIGRTAGGRVRILAASRPPLARTRRRPARADAALPTVSPSGAGPEAPGPADAQARRHLDGSERGQAPAGRDAARGGPPSATT